MGYGDPNLSARYVVVGGGIAGVTCVESLGVLDSEASVVLLSASPTVKRVTGVSFLAKHVVKFEVEEATINDMDQVHVNLIVLYDSLQHIDTESKCIKTSKNTSIRYEYLCLCTGGIPRLIAEAQGCPRVLGIRDTDSVEKFRAQLVNARRMLIVGNGGIASELVHATTGVEKIWVIRDDHISAKFLDPGASQFFQDIFSSTTKTNKRPTILRRQVFTEQDSVGLGSSDVRAAALGPNWMHKLGSAADAGSDDLKIIYKSEVKSIGYSEDGASAYPLRVELTTGETVDCDFAASATGVLPDASFACDAELRRAGDGGLLVDELQETSVTDVFAAGDVASAGWEFAPHWFQMRLWTQARQMGAMAARAMAGRAQGEPVIQDFCFEMFTHATTLYGYQVVLLGLYNGQGLDTYEILLRVTPGVEYVKLVMKEGRLQGALLVGNTGLEEMCENLILNQLDLSHLADDLLDPDLDIDDYFD